MPHIVIHLSGQPDAARDRRVVDAVAGLTQSVLGKKLPVIAITLQHIPRDRWFIGGHALSELGKRRRASSRTPTPLSRTYWANCTSARTCT
jgi:4-oxalocrotonate tautomerase